MYAFACFNFQERLMPYLRAESARRLTKQGLRQNRIAEHLGVSQAMVSKYLRTNIRRPAGASAQYLQTLVERSVAGALQEEQKDRIPAWCPICPELHPGKPGQVENAALAECLRGEGAPPDASGLVIENLKAASKRLQEGEFSRLAPEVFINVAMAIPDARDSRGVAAFPGRLVESKGAIRAVFEPEFGASKHLSQVLLKLRRAHPKIRAILCVRDGEDVRAASKAAGLRTRILKRVRGELQVQAAGTDRPDALVDPGAFGIEPITYLFGETALDAVERAQAILHRLPSLRTERSQA